MIRFQRKNFALGVSIGMVGYMLFTVATQTSHTFDAQDTKPEELILTDTRITVAGLLANATPLVTSSYEGYLDTVGIYDFVSDDSLQKYVSRYIGFLDERYIPQSLQYLNSEYVHTNNRGHKLREEAAAQLYVMAEAFYEEFGKPITIISSYRSYSYQHSLYHGKGGEDQDFVAPPGCSEHQGGLAVDIFLVDTKSAFFANTEYRSYYDRLFANAHYFGFHNSYQKGVEIDTYHEEPWHWRYLGEKLATELRERDMTFAEYYDWRIGGE